MGACWVRHVGDVVEAREGVPIARGVFGCHKMCREVEVAQTLRPSSWALVRVMCQPVASKHFCLLWWHRSHTLCEPMARVQLMLCAWHLVHFGWIGSGENGV